MNETLKTIRNRYSCRSFTGEALGKAETEAFAVELAKKYEEDN